MRLKHVFFIFPGNTLLTAKLKEIIIQLKSLHIILSFFLTVLYCFVSALEKISLNIGLIFRIPVLNVKSLLRLNSY